ncbi:MAG: hypothetical protein JXR37_29590 [Kiritimatiellae bacterium]|nr:hypothetical protein [Kiritimatiellia bacterium]
MKRTVVFKIAGWVAVGVVGVAGLALVLGFAVVWLWNWLMPAIFGLPTVTYWQAVGLIVLAHILFKGHDHHARVQSQRDRHIHAFRSKVRSMLHEDEETSEASEARGRMPDA